MTRVLLILSICLAVHTHRTDAIIGQLFTVVSTLKDIYDYASAVKGVVQDSQWVATGFEDSDANVIRHLNTAMKDVTKRLYNAEENLLNEINRMGATLLHRLPLKLQSDNRLQHLTIRINEVNDVYDNFVFYQNPSNSYENTTIIRFMTELVGDSSKLNHALDRMFDQLVSSEQISPNLLSVITAAESHNEDQHEERCGRISPQKRLFDIYRQIILTEMQGYTMNVYAFGVLKQVHNASYTGELNKLETQFQRRCGQYLRSIKSAMSTIPTDVHLCEPANHIRGETFVEFVKLFQTFIDEEARGGDDICRDKSTCEPLLNVVASTEITHSLYDNSLILPCMGRLVECNRLYGDMLIGCRLPETDSRRYAWVKNADNEVFGEDVTCPNTAQTGLDTRRRWIYSTCRNCACLCADDIRNDSKSHKRINFQPQIADIKQNMVVTGVRMVMENRMLSIQIEQGKLMPLGEITKIDQSWKPINQSLPLSGEEGIDFGAVRYEQRTINLDDITIPDDFVVTGVRFAYRKPRVSAWDFQPFEIQVHATEYNFDTGRLETYNSMWVSAKTMLTDLQDYQRDRTEVTLDEPHNPIKTTRNPEFSKPNKFIKLRASDFRKDAGQSTVPYLDARPLSMEPRFALSGIGLYHRGEAGFGGFLGLRLFGLNIAPHMKSDLF